MIIFDKYEYVFIMIAGTIRTQLNSQRNTEKRDSMLVIDNERERDRERRRLRHRKREDKEEKREKEREKYT